MFGIDLEAECEKAAAKYAVTVICDLLRDVVNRFGPYIGPVRLAHLRRGLSEVTQALESM